MKRTVALAILLASSSMTAFADDHHTVPTPMPGASSSVFFAAMDGSAFASIGKATVPPEFATQNGVVPPENFTHERAAVVESQLAAVQPSKTDPFWR